ncbi:MAG TPA: TRAP transporter substrate-binding protein [Stellaceae bacterium]|nr:TRAP transporter substrate-binding protein [Stellaceae bacterium]
MKRAGRAIVILALMLCAWPRAPIAAEQNLIFDIVGSPGSVMTVGALRPWAERVNRDAAGLIHIDVREGMALATFANIYDRVLDDVIQIGWGLQNAVSGKFPLSEVPAVPFLVARSEPGSVAFWRLYKLGALDSEYDQVMVLAMGMLGAGGLHLGAPPKSLADLGGLKLLVAGRMQSATVTALDGTPISLPLTDMYQAVQRKTVDGVVTGWSSLADFKLDEVAPNHVDVNIGTSASMVFMARKKFDALPPEAQKILRDTAGEELSRQFGIAMDRNIASVRAGIVSKPGQSVIALPQSDFDLWREKTAPVVAAWPKNKQGGDQVLERFRALYQEAASGK